MEKADQQHVDQMKAANERVTQKMAQMFQD
jgi:hypothetical protein